MRKLAAIIVIVLSTVSPLHTDYDPQHTMLALNMAIVSVNRILKTQDRTILQQEYDRIINRLALGNIESDTEMKGLYSELMGFITGKGLRQEDLEDFVKVTVSAKKKHFTGQCLTVSTTLMHLKAAINYGAGWEASQCRQSRR